MPSGGPVGIRTPVFGSEGQKDNPDYPTGPAGVIRPDFIRICSVTS
jgi:hypothetical protein